MTASALNISSIAPNAQAGVGAAANAAGGNALAGFEALLGALFPQTDPTAMAAATPAAGALAGAAVSADAGTTASKDEAKDADDAATDMVDAGQPTPGDTAVALAASLMAAQPATPDVQVTTAKAPTDAPPAWGRDKAKGVPAAPAILHANPRAALAEKADLTAETAPEAADAGQPATETTPDLSAKAAATPAIPATPARPATPAAAAPAQAQAPAQTAPVAEPVAEAPPAPVADAPVETAQVETAALAARAEATPTAATAPAPAAPTKTAKAERTKASDAGEKPGVDPTKPLEAADKPVHANAVQRTAKAGDAAVDAADSRAQDAKAAPEQPEATPMGETRAAAQAATPASAHATHPVRGSPETVANLAAQIVKKLEGKSTRFDVELDPHGLGKVDVRVEIAANGRVTAAMTFDNPQAAADVKARAAELQRQLEQAGFELSGGLSFDVAGDRGQQQQNQAWQDQGETGRAFQGRAFRAALETADDAADAANQGALRLRRGVNAGLDVRI